MVPQLIVAVEVAVLDRRFLEGSVHALDLATDPRVIWLREPMFDVVRPADPIEAVGAVKSGRAATVPGQLGQLDAVVVRSAFDAPPSS